MTYVWVNNTVNPPPPLPRPGSCRSSDSKHRHNISWWRWSKNFLGPTSEIRVRPVKTFCLPRKKKQPTTLQRKREKLTERLVGEKTPDLFASTPRQRGKEKQKQKVKVSREMWLKNSMGLALSYTLREEQNMLCREADGENVFKTWRGWLPE